MPPVEQQYAIETDNLMLGYDNQPIVNNINIQIKPGEFIGILGANGSGKSTFLRSVLGLLKPLAGKILVLGSSPQRGNIKIGYMPQMRNQMSVANLTSRAIMEASLDGTEYGIPFLSATKKATVQNALELVKATVYADRPFQQLSGGERQRIFLAQALLNNPQILLLDEPLANLDPHYQETFMELLYTVQQNLHATILFTAHDANPLLGIMNRVLYFAQGKVAIGKTDEVITSEKLTSLYGTPIEVVNFKNRLFVLGEGRHIYGQEAHHHV